MPPITRSKKLNAETGTCGRKSAAGTSQDMAPTTRSRKSKAVKTLRARGRKAKAAKAATTCGRKSSTGTSQEPPPPGHQEQPPTNPTIGTATTSEDMVTAQPAIILLGTIPSLTVIADKLTGLVNYTPAQTPATASEQQVNQPEENNMTYADTSPPVASNVTPLSKSDISQSVQNTVNTITGGSRDIRDGIVVRGSDNTVVNINVLKSDTNIDLCLGEKRLSITETKIKDSAAIEDGPGSPVDRIEHSQSKSPSPQPMTGPEEQKITNIEHTSVTPKRESSIDIVNGPDEQKMKTTHTPKRESSIGINNSSANEDGIGSTDNRIDSMSSKSPSPEPITGPEKQKNTNTEHTSVTPKLRSSIDSVTQFVESDDDYDDYDMDTAPYDDDEYDTDEDHNDSDRVLEIDDDCRDIDDGWDEEYDSDPDPETDPCDRIKDIIESPDDYLSDDGDEFDY